MREIYKKLKEYIKDEQIFVNEPMSKHTSFKVGGPADIFVKVKTLDELKYVLSNIDEYNISESYTKHIKETN